MLLNALITNVAAEVNIKGEEYLSKAVVCRNINIDQLSCQQFLH